MKCPVCTQLGLRSKVFQGIGSCTLLHCPPYYDEDGVYHNHDWNSTTYGYTCSQGHEWATSVKRGCPAGDCEWNSREDVRAPKTTVFDPKGFELKAS